MVLLWRLLLLLLADDEQKCTIDGWLGALPGAGCLINKIDTMQFDY
jgi:hypothetical protein